MKNAECGIGLCWLRIYGTFLKLECCFDIVPKVV